MYQLQQVWPIKARNEKKKKKRKEIEKKKERKGKEKGKNRGSENTCFLAMQCGEAKKTWTG